MERQTDVTVGKNTKKITGFYFTAVYLFILGTCFLSIFFFFFFERNKKSFSFLSECFCDLLTQTVEKSINSENIHHSRSPSVKRLSF